MRHIWMESLQQNKVGQIIVDNCNDYYDDNINGDDDYYFDDNDDNYYHKTRYIDIFTIYEATSDARGSLVVSILQC